MKRMLIAGSLLVMAVAIFIGVSSVRSKQADRKRQDAYQATVESYRSALVPGMSRKRAEEFLHKQGMAFIGFPAYSDDSAYADLVKIGEEKVGWYCGPGSVNVAIRFETATGRQTLEDPSDTVTGVSLFKLFQDCL
jgi:hypothetical protein